MWLLLAACHHAPTRGPSDPPGGAPTESSAPRSPALVVSAYFSDHVHLFDPETGEGLGGVEGLDGPQTVVAGHDGDWIACSELANAVVRIDPARREVVGTLVADDPATPGDETGGLRNPDAAAFGPDGRLYVSSFETDAVLRYEADGTFVDEAVPAGGGGLDGPDLGLGFDPDGNLVVPGWYSNRIHRFDPDGAPLPDLLGPDDGLVHPREVVFDADGNAFVSGFDSGAVFRVPPGGPPARFAEVSGPTGLALDAASGVLFVGSAADESVHAVDLASGADLGARATNRRIRGITAVRLLEVPSAP